MIKGEKIRFDIYKILYSVHKLNKNLSNQDIQKIIQRHKKEDISFLNNVTLNAMRFHLHSSKIIEKYIKKKIRDKEKILLISAITQIVFLNFKEYAVINCTVEIAKKLKIFHGLINAFLKNVSKDKEDLKKIDITFDDLPIWFKNKNSSLKTSEKKLFLKNFNREPSLHIVFKNEEKLKNFEGKLIKTSGVSGFLNNKKNITKISSFINGDWWVQDFSSFFPLQNLPKINKNKLFLDACAAPGGKAFQLLSRNQNLILNDKNNNRIQILKSNLNRLNFNPKIKNQDFIKFNEKEKFDFIILDVPCSAVGTIRKNPEIFFKNKEPDFDKLNLLQREMLIKASNLLNIKGIILYMACSFLKYETEDQINHFLNLRKDFEILKFKMVNKNIEYSKLIQNNFMLTLPDRVLQYNIDGYFAAYLKKIK